MFISPKLNWQMLMGIMVATVIMVTSPLLASINIRLLGIQPAMAQILNTSDVWQQVYQQLPNFPLENNYVSRDTGKVDKNNTLASRLIRYHVYIKGRAPNYRLDWKLTLADYLGANEPMYDTSYPGHDTLKKNPLDGDRAAIARLNRQQRDALVQVLVNIFTPKQPQPQH